METYRTVILKLICLHQDGFTPLAVALHQRHEEVAEMLLEEGPGAKFHLPVLHLVTRRNDIKSIAFLIQTGSDVNQYTKASDV